MWDTRPEADVSDGTTDGTYRRSDREGGRTAMGLGGYVRCDRLLGLPSLHRIRIVSTTRSDSLHPDTAGRRAPHSGSRTRARIVKVPTDQAHRSGGATVGLIGDLSPGIE